MFSRKAFMVSTALAAITFPGAAVAQAAEVQAAAPEAEQESGERIVVTAQKREQVLLDIPQAVSVVGGETLEEQHADNFSDYLKLIPGLQLNQDTPGSGRLVVRGVNTGGVASTVGVYMDETPF